MSFLSDLRDKIAKAFAPTPPAKTVQACPGAISEKEAQKLFDKLKAHTEIPFNYPPDCCYARASAMSDLMAAEGVESNKVWTYGTLVPMKPDGTPVRFPPAPTGRQVVWSYHVAPTIKVQRADGSCVDMVMDPSLTKGPVTVGEWNKIMSGPGSSLNKTAASSRDVFYRDEPGNRYYEKPGDDRNTAFAEHVKTRDAALNP